MKHLQFLIIGLFSFSILAQGADKASSKPDNGKGLAKLRPSENSQAANQLILKLQNQLKRRPENLRVRENLSHSYFRKGEYKKVIELLSTYQDELKVRSLLDLSKSFTHLKKYKNALDPLRLLLNRDKEVSRYHFLMGKLYFEISQIEEQHFVDRPIEMALESLRNAKVLTPDHRPTYELILKIYDHSNSYYEIVTLINVMVQKFGEHPEFYTQLCRAYYKQQFVDQTIAACKKAILESPNTPESHVYLSSGYMGKNKKSLARRILITSGRKFKDSLFVQLTLGKYFFDKANFPTSLRYYAQASRADPKSARAHLGVAQSKFETNDYEGALKAFVLSCQNDVRQRKWLESARTRLKAKSQSYQLESAYNMAIYKCKSSMKAKKFRM